MMRHRLVKIAFASLAALSLLGVILVAEIWARSSVYHDRVEFFRHDRLWQAIAVDGKLQIDNEPARRNQTERRNLELNPITLELQRLQENLQRGPDPSLPEYEAAPITAAAENASRRETILSEWRREQNVAETRYTTTQAEFSVDAPHAVSFRLAFPLAACSLLPVAWLAWTVPPVLRCRRRLALGQCAACGYDLRFSTEKCPECGAAVDQINVFCDGEFVGYLKSKRIHDGLVAYRFVLIASVASKSLRARLDSSQSLPVEVLVRGYRKSMQATRLRRGRLTLNPCISISAPA